MTSSTAVLMVRHAMLLVGLVTDLQDLSPGSRSCPLNRSAVRMWLLHKVDQSTGSSTHRHSIKLPFMCSWTVFSCVSVHSDVPCDSTTACPDGSTCCKTKEGGWACCPLPQVNHPLKTTNHDAELCFGLSNRCTFNFFNRPCVVMTSSTAVLMVRHVMLLVGLVTNLQDLSPGSRSCPLNRSAVRMWLLHKVDQSTGSSTHRHSIKLPFYVFLNRLFLCFSAFRCSLR